MKIQDIKEIKAKPLAELKQSLQESRDHLRSLRFDLVAGKVKNVREIRAVRRYIARLLTCIRDAAQSTK